MNDTPMMQQYRNFKEKYSDAVLFFRVGDFYEMFDEDALDVSSLLNLTLTHRGDSPMCGIPFHASKNYIKRLLDCGKKIAICEQLELSDSFKTLAKRDVIRIVTPATVVEDGFFDSKSSNYILSIYQSYCAFCDITTGVFLLKYLDSGNRIESIREVIQQIFPTEILVLEDEYFLDKDFRNAVDGNGAMVTKLAPWYFSLKKAGEILCSHVRVNSLKAFGIDDSDKIICPAGALLKYVQDTAKNPLNQICSYKIVKDEAFLSMDESSRKNLELFRNLYDGSGKFSLFATINRCKTFSGQRLLKDWLSFPLHDIESIVFRQNWVKFFVSDPDELARVRTFLSGALDMNRLTTRVLMKRATPHDLVAIKQSIGTFFSIVSDKTDRYRTLFSEKINSENLDKASVLMNEIYRAIKEEFLGQFNAGEVIKDGYDSCLDELRNYKEHSDAVLNGYLESEKQKTGITILKLGFNKIYGYYLEIPKGQITKAPAYFIRRQTLVNGERYTTEELQKYERDIFSSVASAEQRERELFDNLCSSVCENMDILNSIGEFTAKLDVFQSFAELATDSDYVCPEMTEDDVLEIKNGRHPVVEKQTGKTEFTANDLNMDIRFSLITGPNMAGKSTFLRQNALIILLAHIGSFVPASYAKIGLTDRIFCRVGATDNLARGESTFLIEMQETAYILRNSTERSFVIVDEIGRGTSTQDGMAIAYAVMNELIKKGCKTLFATHYHELTMLDNSGISLKTLLVEEKNGEIVFLRKVVDGKANSSYGIHVAKLAGIPYPVIREAKAFQKRHTDDFSNQQNSLFTAFEEDEDVPESEDFSNFKEAAKLLESINPDECTPMQAMIHLVHLKELVKK